MKRLLPGVLLAAFVLDARATDSLQNGCGLDYTRVRPAFLVNPRGEGNRIFAEDYWDVCVPLGQCNFIYNGVVNGNFYSSALTSTDIQGSLIRLNYPSVGGFLNCLFGEPAGFARYTMPTLQPGRYTLEYARANAPAGTIGPYVVQGRLELEVIRAPVGIPVPINASWTMGLLLGLVGAAGLAAIRRAG